ncbi:frizzled-4 [Plodia interpunctella]|uniref:frizzled-4 n=1 Tax=Plodia interpunctella TaxID=58824 RepID=UPI0023688CB4|nr:frizzled-4 [Plodia interpunctella]
MKCFIAILFTVTLVTGAAAEASVRTCEPIKVAMCKNIGYNQTGMPNLARHSLQADADVTLQTFSPLVQYGCSPQLDLFLCTVYVPMCTDKVALPIGPCRGLCETVYARCYPVLQGFGFQWPAELDCSLFPAENNHEHMCMEGPGDHGPPVGSIPLDHSVGGSGACQRLVKPKSWVWVRGSGRCAQFCEAEVLWEAGERRAAEVWLATWAALSFACTLAAVGAQLACGDRGRAGERALVLVALCRCAAAAGWGVRAAAGRTAAGCAKDSAIPTRMLLAHDGLANPNCAVVFLLLYYFGLAASVWWVVVAGAWRASVLRPPQSSNTPSRNERHSSLLQLAAWGVPAALAAAVLVTRDVDADELTGTCFVGNQSSKSLLALVIVPEAICLLLGSVFLASGLRALLRRPAPTPVPSALLSTPQAMTDQSLLRLGAFAALYAVPSACILATWMYEYAWRDSWLAAPMPSSEPSTHPRPAFWVFLFRIFASQILGVMVAVWIATPRLKALWRMMAGPRKPPMAKCPPGPPPTPLTLHCYATHPHTLTRHMHKYATYRPPQVHSSYRKPRHYHYSAGETIL